jgi:predicted dehydrogenase
MRCLVIGLGGIGQRHVRNLRALCGDSIELIAYRVRRDTPLLTDDLRVASDQSVETEYGIEIFSDLEHALSRKPNFALICNPSSLHISTAIRLAEADCALFIEKPLSNSPDGVDQLIAVCEERGLLAFVAFQWRFHPLFQRLKELAKAGGLDDLVSIQAEVGEYLPNWHPYEDYRRMYAARKEQGGGVILSQIHELDYLYWLFGLPDRLFAIGGSLGGLDIDVEDTVSLLMDFGGVPAQLHLDYIQRPGSRRLKIVTKTLVVIADLLAPKLEIFKEGNLIEEDSFPGFTRNEMFLAEMRHFLSCLRGEAPPLTTLRDGFASLQIALAAKNSLETRAIVAINPLF